MHYDGDTLVAVERAQRPAASPLRCDHLGRRSRVEPALTRISPATTREAVAAFLRTNRRPGSLDWVPAEQD